MTHALSRSPQESEQEILTDLFSEKMRAKGSRRSFVDRLHAPGISTDPIITPLTKPKMKNLSKFQQRREFLKQLAAGSAAAWMANDPGLLAEEEVEHPEATADACILLWMGGGMAAPETFDPKRYEPFQKGLAVEKILSTFPAINTPVDGMQISAGLENVASVMDRATLIRSHVQADLGNILHSRHQYHWHTGYVPPQTVAAPHIGSWMAKTLGPNNPVIPPFINIGQRIEGVGEQEELKAFTTAGFFGTEFGPFNLPFPEDAVAAVRPPKGMEPGRFANRWKHYQKLVDQESSSRSDERSPAGVDVAVI